MSISVDPEQPFHVALGGNVTLLTLEGLDHAFQAEQINEETLIWQEGLGEWLSLQAVLAELDSEESAAEQESAGADEYFVSFGPSDVRKLSLDQLDDFYRLDVINDATPIWQPGATEWLPLSLLIGSGAEPEHVSIAPAPTSVPAPAGHQGLFSMGPSPGATQAGAGMSPGQVLPGSRQHRHAPAPASSGPWAPQSSQFPVSASSAGPSSTRPSGMSFSPVALTAPVQPQRASPWFRRSLAVAAVFCAFVVTQRNGLAQAAAESTVGTAAWAGVEQNLGGTSVMTPHGLAGWLSELDTQYKLDELSETADFLQKEQRKKELKAEEAAEAEQARVEEERERAEEAKEKLAEKAAAATKTSSGSANALSARMKAGLSGDKSASRSAPVRQRPSTRPKKKSGSSLPTSGSLDSYDPMNGTL